MTILASGKVRVSRIFGGSIWGGWQVYGRGEGYSFFVLGIQGFRSQKVCHDLSERRDTFGPIGLFDEWLEILVGDEMRVLYDDGGGLNCHSSM